jgi:hypothetical protein
LAAAIEQHGAEPGFGIGVAPRHRPERRLCRAEIAGAVSGDACAQRRRHVGRVLLRKRGTLAAIAAASTATRSIFIWS